MSAPKNSVDMAIWTATVGAAYARQVFDDIAAGKGPPDDETSDRFLEEAEAVADMAIDSRDRERLVRAGRT